MPPILSARQLTFGFERGRTFLGPLDLDLVPGRFLAVLGPNGAGKSTLLRLLAGLLRPTSGRIDLGGRPATSLGANARARLLAFLPQHPEAPASATAGEVVCLGRYPYRSLHLFESPEDLNAVHEAMRETDTLPFADRRMDTLSGGETQRVHLAAALAQYPQIMLLDEPTSGLDLRHQLSLLGLLRRLTTTRGLAVVAVLHDLNLAAQFGDEVALLSAGRLVARGSPDDVLLESRLEDVYRVRFAAVAVPERPRPWLVAQSVADDAARGDRP